MCALSILHIDPQEVTCHLQHVLPLGLAASLFNNRGTLALGLNNRYITILKFQCRFQWQVSSFTIQQSNVWHIPLVMTFQPYKWGLNRFKKFTKKWFHTNHRPSHQAFIP